MPDDFNPYRKWLGIPEKDQPPHYYRLLNLELFEKDPEVISNAVDARMSQIKQYQAGKHSDASQKILNEIAAAKVCLLNAEKKAEYDEELSAKLKPGELTDEAAAVLPTAVPLTAPQPGLDRVPGGREIPRFGDSSVAAHVSNGSEQRQKQQKMLLVVGIVAGVVVLVSLAALQFTRSGGDVADGTDSVRSTNDPGTTGPSDANGGPGGQAGSAVSVRPDPDDVLSEIMGQEKPRLLGDLMNGDDPGETGTGTGGELPSADGRHGLVGEYFADRTLTRKVFERVDPQIQFDFDESPPDPPMPKDYFSIRWTGWLVAPEPGNYQLSTLTDDGVCIWLDGEKVIDNWKPGPPRRSEATVTLTDRPHAIKIEYMEQNLTAVMYLNWSRPGVFEEQPIPTEALLIAKPSAPPPDHLVNSEPPTVEPPLSEPPVSEPPVFEPPVAEPPVAEPPPGPKRLAVPDPAARERIKKDIREIFEDEFAAATTPAKKAALAKTLYSQSRASSDDPDSRFVLLSEACDLSAQAGDVSGAMQIVDTMQEHYGIKPLSVKIFVLKTATESMPSGSSGQRAGRAIVDAAMALADEYAGQDDYETASGFADLAMNAARKTKNSSLIQPLTAKQREFNRMKARFASIKKARNTLSANPDDPAANLTVGRWYCFSRDDWAKGLPLLVKGDDVELAEVAEKEMDAPTDPSAQVALADGWYGQAEKENGELKSAIQSRAKFWYNQAFPSLEGLEKVKVKKRLEAIAEAETAGPEPKKPKSPIADRGVVQPGNVALASNGTTVSGVSYGSSYLLDGRTSGYAYSRHPCEWTITFDKVYRLQAIAFLLRGSPTSSYYYRYAVAISPDGKNYVPLFNASQGQWRSWQRIPFKKPQPVKSIKLFGLYNSYSSYFYVGEFEAYCVIPR